MRNLSNISLREFREVLKTLGLSFTHYTGGHETWWKKGCRPVIFQTHKDPVPVHIVKNALRDMGITRQQFLEILEGE